MSTSLERQMWLEKVVLALRQHFLDCGWTVPHNVRVSIGIPKGMHGQKKAIGQCWSDRATSDGYYEIFSSPEQGAEFDQKLKDVQEIEAQTGRQASLATSILRQGRNAVRSQLF